MISKKGLIAVGILLTAHNSSFAANVSEYNYDPNMTKKQTGVDVSAVIDCGYNYGTAECDPNNPAVKKGYNDSTNIVKGAQDGRAANKNQDIYDPQNTKKLGINSMEDHSNIIKYGDTRDLSKQQGTITDLYGGGGNVDGLKGTYNTNVIPDKEGLTLKNKCMQYTDAQLSSMSQGSNRTQADIANQCLVIRTVANTNDSSVLGEFSKTDPLRDSVVKRSTGNVAANNYVAKAGSSTSAAAAANSQSYSCDTEPTRTEYQSSTCSTYGIGRHQVCTQQLQINCGVGATGTREVPECTAGMDKGTVRLVSTNFPRQTGFVTTDSGFSLNEKWNDGGSSYRWEFTFLVKNPDKVSMIFDRFYFDNKSQFFLNGQLIASADSSSSDGSQVLNLNMQKWLLVGQNSFVIETRNYHGPAAANFQISIEPSSYVGCMCRESWKTVCDISKVRI